MENLPIDIHSNKLLDWLISRRHCPKGWRDAVELVRAKIGHAMQDMPENAQIMGILSTGQYINYFHCKQIVEILRETEKESKNIFGMYSSQRMKDWKEIISLYEKDNIYLAEAANFLQRFVQYEVPALRKQIGKAESTASEAERKEQDYAKQSAEGKRALERELAKWELGYAGGDLRRALLAVADAAQPAEVDAATGDAMRRVLHYFAHFTKFVGKDTSEMFPLIRFVLSAINKAGDSPPPPPRSVSEITVFEWRHGTKPNVILPPSTDRLLELPLGRADEPNKDDEIDFGDDDEAEIDFCTNGGGGEYDATTGIELVMEDGEAVPKMDSAVDEGIARGEEALPLLEHLGVRKALLDELDQLSSFLDFRLQDELAESAASIYLASLTQKPVELGSVGVEDLKIWLSILRRTIAELSEPKRLQLLRIRTSPRFVDEIIAQLEQKGRLEAKYRQLELLSGQKQQQCAEEIRGAQKLLDGVVEAAKALQEDLEKDLSGRYNGREVYIMGEINAVLYGS